MKLVVVPNKVDNLEEYIKIGARAFIFGLYGYCSGYSNSLNISDIKRIREMYPDIEIFVSMNKNFFNSELESVEKMMLELNDIGINGILYYDLCILNIKKRLNLDIDLVWNQTHMVTNYNTCNYYLDKGVKYGVLSSEITLEEINEIKDRTKMKLFANIIGYPIMSFSRRNLLNNYFISTNKEKKSKQYVITNNNEEYIIREELNGNSIYYGKVLNGSVVVPDIKVDYLILNEDLMDHDIFIKVLHNLSLFISTNDKNYMEEIDSLIGDYRGFFFQKTIYKVKKNG